MVNSTQKFLRGGGTKVITNKSEIKKVVIKDLRRSTGGGSSSSSSSSSSGDGGAAARAAEAARVAETARQADIERAARQDRARQDAAVAAEQKKQVEIRAVQRKEEKSLATISAVEKRTDFKERPLASFKDYKVKQLHNHKEQEDKRFSTFKAGAISTALGFASPFVHLTSAAINPIDTATALKGSLSDPKGTGKAIKSSLVTSFQTDPSFATGALLGEVALLKAPTGITKQQILLEQEDYQKFQLQVL